MDKDDKQVDGSSKTTPEIIKPMDTATKAVIAGSGAMALSFFLGALVLKLSDLLKLFVRPDRLLLSRLEESLATCLRLLGLGDMRVEELKVGSAAVHFPNETDLINLDVLAQRLVDHSLEVFLLAGRPSSDLGIEALLVPLLLQPREL